MLYDFLVHLVNPLLTLFNGRPQIEHKDRLPEGNYIIVAPHRTWLDPVLLALAVYPKKFTFMAKEELFKGRFANWFLRKSTAKIPALLLLKHRSNCLKMVIAQLSSFRLARVIPARSKAAR